MQFWRLCVVVGCLTLQGCHLAPTVVPVVSKESFMKPQDQNKPQKSRPPVPETVGATSEPIHLSKDPASFQFEIHAPTGPALLRADGAPKRVFLRVEGVKSYMPAPSFDVYLNLPPGEDPERHPDLLGLTISTFGLVERSRPTGNHPGNGLSFVQDVTDLYARLMADKDWDRKNLRVSVIPAPSGGYPVDVTVDRVSLLIE
jgi:hypothetical protein